MDLLHRTREKQRYEKARKRFDETIRKHDASIAALDTQIEEAQQRVDSAVVRAANSPSVQAYRREGAELVAKRDALKARKTQFDTLRKRAKGMRDHLEDTQMAQEVTKQNNIMADFSSKSSVKPDDVVKSYEDVQGHLDDMDEIKDVHQQFTMTGDMDMAEMDFDALVSGLTPGSQQVEFSAETELAALRDPPTRPVKPPPVIEEEETDTARLIEFDTS